DLLIERNVFKNNGVAAEAGSANLDLEVLRPVVQLNTLGSPVSGSDAENVRDSSAGLIFRYNFVDGGNRLLLFQGPSAFSASPEYLESRVYGNVLLKS